MIPQPLPEIVSLIRQSNVLHLDHTFARYGAKGSRSLPVIVVDHPCFDAEILLQGAQLLRFTPKGDSPWLWLSPLADFIEGQPVRGGVPLCLPWFGPHPDDKTQPKHGFARLVPWRWSAVDVTAGRVLLEFHLDCGNNSGMYGRYDFSACLQMILSDQIHLSLTVLNRSKEDLSLGFAFHSYFCVESLQKALVHGLDGARYLDNLRQGAVCRQKGDISFTDAVDRVFPKAGTRQQLVDGTHRIQVNSTTCPSCIVWNPQKKQALTMPDTLDHFRRFVCVERGCVSSQMLSLPYSMSHRYDMTITR